MEATSVDDRFGGALALEGDTLAVGHRADEPGGSWWGCKRGADAALSPRSSAGAIMRVSVSPARLRPSVAP